MARRKGVTWKLDRQGSTHDWTCGPVNVTVPRHREINEMTANGICRTLEKAFGKGWRRE